jgi:aryl-alcohol dehydrogenase-like predicted oxidoreductase
MSVPLPPRLAAAFSGRIGLGCVTFGREIDQATAFAVMDRALERGIRLFDTAAVYAAGASERIVGAWRKARAGAPDLPAIATKAFPPYTPEDLERSAAASRERLGGAPIDVLFLHKWDPAVDDPATLRALDRLVREGRVGMIGASNFSASQLERMLEAQAALGLTPTRCLQNNHNFAVRGIDADLRRLAAAHDVALVSYSPLGAGFLSGKHDAGVHPGSRFDLIPGHQAIYFQPNARARLAQLSDLAVRTRRPLVQLALAWALSQPEVATVLIGGRSPAHVDQAFAALEAAADGDVHRVLQEAGD